MNHPTSVWFGSAKAEQHQCYVCARALDCQLVSLIKSDQVGAQTETHLKQTAIKLADYLSDSVILATNGGGDQFDWRRNNIVVRAGSCKCMLLCSADYTELC